MTIDAGAAPEPGVKAVTHIHTLHSWDSRTSIERTVDALVETGVGLALVSDHNSYEGSWKCRAEAARRSADIRIPTAAEVRTDKGDVIVVFDHDSPPPIDDILEWHDLLAQVRAANGLIWLPHPYQSHVDVELLAAEADVVEVFNARCSDDQNRRSQDLCQSSQSVPGYGFDAHRRSELTRFSVVYPEADSVLDQFRTSPFCDAPVPTRRSDLAAAEVVYGVHRRSPKKIAYFGAKWLLAQASETSQTKRTVNHNDVPAAIVMGDIDLVTAVGLAGIPVISANAREKTIRYSRIPERKFSSGDGWAAPVQALEAVETAARAESSPPVLIYGHDEDVLMIAEHGERLSQTLRFVSPAPELARDLVDKARFMSLADRLDLPVPQSMSRSCRDSPPPTDRDISFPIIVKPSTREPARWAPAAGRAKALRFDSPDEITEQWGLLQEIDADVIIQEFLPGPERDIVSYHVYVDGSGSIVCDFTGRKLRTFPMEYGHTTALEITADEDVLSLGRDLVQRIQFTGVAKFDFKPDPSGSLRLLEVNPRFSLWHHPAALAGVNVPAIVHADLTDGRRPPIRLRPGVHWCKPLTDLAASRADGMSGPEWLAFVRGAEARHAVSLHDPFSSVGIFTAASQVIARRAMSELRSVTNLR